MLPRSPAVCFLFLIGPLTLASAVAASEKHSSLVTVTVNDRLVLVADVEDQGKNARAQTWWKLKEIALHPTPLLVNAASAVASLAAPLRQGLVCTICSLHGLAEGFEIEVDDPDATTATLKGSIRLTVEHSGSVDIDELKLMRHDPTDNYWHIDPDQIESMGTKLGFPAPAKDLPHEESVAPPRPGTFPWQMVVVMLMLVAITGAGLWFFRRRGRQRSGRQHQ